MKKINSEGEEDLSKPAFRIALAMLILFAAVLVMSIFLYSCASPNPIRCPHGIQVQESQEVPCIEIVTTY